ncbi:MAG: 16S rRNA (cytosine(967)-C(5))-methyltransferase RsmB [Clostridia bacterium]|nr:16S rRNA (cytosine(967)-C(5))-methyltransferase RsmB [Clostridia bacterium]
MKNPRQIAFEALLKIQRDGAYSNLALDSALKEHPELEERDRAFVSNLVYGTLDHQIQIDYNLGLYLTQPVRKLKPELHTVLRMGAYQLLFMDKVPARAAVNESVELAKVNKSRFAASMVNAVLRRMAEQGLQLPQSDENDPNYLAIKYSCPEWILSLWIDAYGRETALALAQAALEPAPLTIRTNTVKMDADALIWRLAEDGAISEHSALLPEALILANGVSIDRMTAYQEGLFHVQDLASQLCCAAVDPQPRETVFDLCAAPGGKTFTMAQRMQNTGCIRAFDVYQSRVELIRSGAQRLGLQNVYAYLSDATIYNENYGKADRVLCDVPCSGLGILRRKPEIRFKQRGEIDNLPDLQYRILCNATQYLKDGGRLVYSTCTLNPAENQGVCDRFLAAYPAYHAVRVLPEIPRIDATDYLTLMPQVHGTDGFFIAVFENGGGLA